MYQDILFKTFFTVKSLKRFQSVTGICNTREIFFTSKLKCTYLWDTCFVHSLLSFSLEFVSKLCFSFYLSKCIFVMCVLNHLHTWTFLLHVNSRQSRACVCVVCFFIFFNSEIQPTNPNSADVVNKFDMAGPLLEPENFIEDSRLHIKCGYHVQASSGLLKNFEWK